MSNSNASDDETIIKLENFTDKIIHNESFIHPDIGKPLITIKLSLVQHQSIHNWQCSIDAIDNNAVLTSDTLNYIKYISKAFKQNNDSLAFIIIKLLLLI